MAASVPASSVSRAQVSFARSWSEVSVLDLDLDGRFQSYHFTLVGLEMKRWSESKF